ncbi:TPA: plasmid recombination protein [Staphylococcus aureus]
MDNRIAYKVKKTNCKTGTKNLLKEMFREEKDRAKYDNGVRDLHPEKTKENVWLLKPDIETFDKERKEKIKEINTKRANRKEEDGYTAYDRRKLRADTVDMLSQVVQPSTDWIKRHSKEEVIELLTGAYEMMKEHPELYGEVKAAVIHLDESSAHMQILSSALDMDNLRSNAKELVGNKTAMSEKQTTFANGLKERGFDVERGVNRLNNNYKKRKEYLENKYGRTVTRHNEHEFERLEQQEQEFKDNIVVRATQLGLVDSNGNYHFKDDSGNQQHMNVSDMIVADLIDLGIKTNEREKRMQQADLDFIQDEHSEKLSRTRKEHDELLEKNATNKRVLDVQRKEQFELSNDIQRMKNERETAQSDLLRAKSERDTFIQGNDTLRRENAELTIENEQLTMRNKFLKELGSKNVDERTKMQDNAVMSYLRHGVYKDNQQSLSDLYRKSFDFIDKNAQRRYGRHMKGAPVSRQRTNNKDVEREL